MGYELKGKRVLVTGASAGIGAALARGFAARGAVVGICARRAERLAQVLADCRKHAPDSRSWTIDLGLLDGLGEFAARVERELGGVDVVVHNAAIPKRRKVGALSPATVEEVMRVNYFSPVRLTLALLPGIVARRGRIVHLSSVAARLSPPGEAAYAASKAALSTWAESIAVDLWDTGVKIHVVYPGVIDTELFTLPDNDPSVTPVEKLPVEAIVEPVLQLIERDELEVYVPEYFAEIARRKLADSGAFLAGSAAWLRSQNRA